MTYLITGVAGFIGSNLAERLLRAGHLVVGVDNLGRKGAHDNLARLYQLGGLEFHEGDIRNGEWMAGVFSKYPSARAVFHLAGQVAVTTSMVDPRDDFGSNAMGTFNVLEAVRTNEMLDTAVVYSSTNKVYGGLTDLEVVERGGRYEFADLPSGVSETRSLDFHSPYGCSKGCGDQYMRDYARVFGLKTVCLRQSCIYGYNQFGIEDQGWVAWLTIAALLGKEISIYGDGRQVRDVLFIDDLVDAYLAAIDHIDKTAGGIFNIGGGPENTLSLLELVGLLEDQMGKKLCLKFAGWRPGDQRVFVCDIRKAEHTFGWRPKITTGEGIEKLYNWACAQLDVFRRLFV
jgi:CDP-paratose 2-epimerase